MLIHIMKNDENVQRDEDSAVNHGFEKTPRDDFLSIRYSDYEVKQKETQL